MKNNKFESLHQHLVLEVRRKAELSGVVYDINDPKNSIYAKAIVAADSLTEPGDLIALHDALGSDFGTILHTAVASYVRDRK